KDANQANHPEAFYLKNGKLTRRDATDPTVARTSDWIANACQASGQRLDLPVGVDTTNPLALGLSCTVNGAFTAGSSNGGKPVASWAAVWGTGGYDYAGNVYQRGCVDQCQVQANGACGTGATCDSGGGGRACTCNQGWTDMPTQGTLHPRDNTQACVT